MLFQRWSLYFFVLFTGFPRISWNVGPESKYLEVVQIGLSNKVDHRTTTTKKKSSAFLFIGQGKRVLLWKVLVWKRVGETVAGWSETSLQLSGRASMPHWVEGGPFMCISYFLEGCSNVQRQKAL